MDRFLERLDRACRAIASRRGEQKRWNEASGNELILVSYVAVENRSMHDAPLRRR